MVQIEEIRGVDGVTQLIARSGVAARRAGMEAMRRIAAAVRKKAFEYAPKSPTQTITSRTLKLKRRTSSKKTPGGLERSIRGETENTPEGPIARIFIASNSEAGAYAKRIHDEKGKTWWKRGPGTVAKGPQADEKFVFRAIEDLRQYFVPILEQEIRKELARA